MFVFSSFPPHGRGDSVKNWDKLEGLTDVHKKVDRLLAETTTTTHTATTMTSMENVVFAPSASPRYISFRTSSD